MSAYSYSRIEIDEMASELLKTGMTPRRARLHLALEGIRWEYQYLGQARRSRERRLRQQHLKPCPSCPLWMAANLELCPACLEAKWNGDGNARPYRL
jgi:hypothetical protein